MENLMSYLLIAIMLGVGVYGLYTVIRLWHLKYLFPNKFIYPANCKPEDCTDAPGFIRFIAPRLAVLSVLFLVGGILLLLIGPLKLLSVPAWVELFLIPGVGMALFVWYIWVQSRVFRRFW